MTRCKAVAPGEATPGVPLGATLHDDAPAPVRQGAQRRELQVIPKKGELCQFLAGEKCEEPAVNLR